jgi:hypothetical protein
MIDPELWNFQFEIEVSTRYHEWRRGTLEARLLFARGATFVGAIIALITAFNPLDWAPHWVAGVIASSAIVIACINLWELVFRLSEKTLAHIELYRRFMKLQEEIAKAGDKWKDHLAEWRAEAAAIRSDEPPTMWAVYAECWNQTMDRYQLEQKGYYRPVQWWQHLLRNEVQFSPQSFPAPT